MRDIKSIEFSAVEALLKEKGYPRFRADQIASWLKKGVSSFDEMTNLPKDIRELLKTEYYFTKAEIVRKRVSAIDGTVKYLFRLNDGEYIESVVMNYHHGSTICISTQVGCRMGCTFCATGKSGFSRSLNPTEMLAQIEAAQRDLNIRISNIVLMGMGEPFDNYDNVIAFIRLVSSESSLNIGMRHITLSTCGIVPRIYDFADLMLQVGLSVSLHAPNDAMRSRTMPINRAYPIAELISACRYYVDKTHRRITFEYALIEGENDSDSAARELAALLKGILCHVNLIPVNNVAGAGYKKSNIKRQKAFVDILSAYGVNATVRRTLGSDIEASCGQLKRNFLKGDE